MGAPNVTYSVQRNRISDVAGFDSLTVTFSADREYTAFECRATNSGDDWGVGMGALIASFSQTPANTERTFEVYDDFLLNGDREYRISLYVQGTDGSWNDTIGFIPSGSDGCITADGKVFLCRKGDVYGGV